MGSRRLSLFLYMLALFGIGLGYIAITPAFEGFDEYAHYSSMREIADTQTIPLLNASYIDQAFIDYKGPAPLVILSFSTEATTVTKANLTFSNFFTQPDAADSYIRANRQTASPAFQPSQDLNWQAQHPPLYYLLMAPFVKATDSLPVVTQLFILRVLTYGLALMGVAFGLAAIDPGLSPLQQQRAQLGFYFYPLMLPMFFPEFARLGNDSLCLMWAGLIAYLLSWWRRDENNKKLPVALGIVLGLGLLTKAFFIPLGVALFGFLWLRQKHVLKAHGYLHMVMIFYPAFMMGGAWYLYNFVRFETFDSHIDALILAKHGGIVAGLMSYFSPRAFMRSVYQTLYTYFWGGTWSSGHLPELLYAPLFVLVACIVSSTFRDLKKHIYTDFAWLPVWMFISLIMGLLYHVMIGLATDGMGHTPGWYLHILMPLIAPLLGLGLGNLIDASRTKFLMLGLLGYAFLFQTIALWTQICFFTGCALKTENGFYTFPDNAFCLNQTALIFQRMTILGWPLYIELGFGTGLICALALYLHLRNPKTGVEL